MAISLVWTQSCTSLLGSFLGLPVFLRCQSLRSLVEFFLMLEHWDERLF